MIVVDHVRCTFVHFKLGARLLNLGCLLVETRSELRLTRCGSLGVGVVTEPRKFCSGRPANDFLHAMAWWRSGSQCANNEHDKRTKAEFGNDVAH
jgi:hypothetical protein